LMLILNMSIIRKVFKKVMINGNCYLYPWPVVKGQKYLIAVDVDQADSIIKDILEGSITSPDEKPAYLSFKEFHKDGTTSIFEISNSNKC